MYHPRSTSSCRGLTGLFVLSLWFALLPDVFAAPLNRTKIDECVAIAANASAQIIEVNDKLDQFKSSMQDSLNVDASTDNFEKVRKKSAREEADAKIRIDGIRKQTKASICTILAGADVGDFTFEDDVHDPNYGVSDIRPVSVYWEYGQDMPYFLVRVDYSVKPRKFSNGLVRKAPRCVSFVILDDTGELLTSIGITPRPDRKCAFLSIPKEIFEKSAKIIITNVDW
jgi:hypothetical protein